jgi:hypothetical protein
MIKHLIISKMGLIWYKDIQDSPVHFRQQVSNQYPKSWIVKILGKESLQLDSMIPPREVGKHLEAKDREHQEKDGRVRLILFARTDI